MRTILFICTGNTCRSQMAEGIARHLAREHDDSVFVASAGVAGMDGAGISPEVQISLEEHGIEHDGQSSSLTAEMIRNASLVLCMTEAHQSSARGLVKDDEAMQAKIQLLDPGHDMPDPIGQGQAAYDALRDRMLELLPGRLTEFLEEEQA